MKKVFFVYIGTLLLFFFSCRVDNGVGYHQPDWSVRKVQKLQIDSLLKSKTYLPVYAQIYEMTEERKVDLAATISIRNTDTKDTVYLNKIDYYNTEGHLIRKYIDAPVYLKPAETIEIIIKSEDNEGGTGANFIFEWFASKKNSKPLFEAVMISTSGQQGISFSSRGVDLNE